MNKYSTLKIFILTSSIMVWSLIMLWLCRRSGFQHDFLAYIKQWQLFLGGFPPWSTNNAYGPIHLVIGYLLLLGGPFIPKFFIVGMLLIANAFLIFELKREQSNRKTLFVYFLAVPANILVIGMGIIYGLNDALVASLIVFAIILRHRGYLIFAGIIIGIAALLKFYPLVFLPFFALDNKRLNLPLIISGLAVFCVGIFISILIWGHGPLDPIISGISREPKLLSIFAALQSVFREGEILGLFIRYNAYIVIIGVLIVLFFAWKNGLSWLESAVLGYLVMLILYKVGHQQFYIPFLFMLASLPIVNKKSAEYMAFTFLPIALLISLYQYGYQFGSDRYMKELGWVRSYGGFIAFLVGITCIIVYAFYLLRYQKTIEKYLMKNVSME